MNLSKKSPVGINRLSKGPMAINILKYFKLAEYNLNTYEHIRNWIYECRTLKSRCIMKMYRNF